MTKSIQPDNTSIRLFNYYTSVDVTILKGNYIYYVPLGRGTKDCESQQYESNEKKSSCGLLVVNWHYM